MAISQSIQFPDGNTATFWQIMSQTFNADGSVSVVVGGWSSSDALSAGDDPMQTISQVIVNSPTPANPTLNISAVPVAYSYSGDYSTVLAQSYSLLNAIPMFVGGNIVDDVTVALIALPPHP